MAFDRDKLRAGIAALAAEGVFIGTSSWKYEGWLGQLYSPDRYEYRGKFARSRFQRNCLAEYAATFKTVCVDAAYYTFPTTKFLQALGSQTPEDFRFALKVTDEITIRKYPKLDRFGIKAGRRNENFLNAALFQRLFLEPCESIRSKVGLLVFEFSRFRPEDYKSGREFMSELQGFFETLPRGWPYGVEIRNRNFLHPDYFDMLRAHNVAHVFNSWDNMPSVAEQLALAGSFTSEELTGARMLLRPGRNYEEAVKLFSPYNAIKDPYPEGRAAILALIKRARRMGARGKGFIYINNRFEGSALQTIASILEALEKGEAGEAL